MSSLSSNFVRCRGMLLVGLLGMLIMVVALSGWGCAGREPDDGVSREAAADSKADVGRPRVATVVPSVVELIAAMGRGDQLVARGRYCDWPPELRRLPIVGDAVRLDHERLIVLRPDLLILNTADASVSRRLAERGIRVIAPRMETIEDVYDVIEMLGRELHAASEAAELATTLRDNLQAISESARRSGESVPVLVTFPDLKGGADVSVIGSGTFLDELLTLAGGRNVVETVGYPMMAMERAASLNPEVIIVSAPGDMGVERSDDHYRAAWSRWKSVPAVRNDRVFVLRETYLTLPGPRMDRAAELLARTLRRTSADGPGAGAAPTEEGAAVAEGVSP